MVRALRMVGWTLGGLVLLALLLIGAVLVAGNLDAGRRAIEYWTARLSGGHVVLQGLGGAFPTYVELGELRLADERGVWLTARQIAVQWHPLQMLHWHVQAERVEAGLIDFERLPVSHPTSHHHGPSVPHIDIGHASIVTLQLGAPLAGTLTSLTVEGEGHWHSLTDAGGQLTARRTNGQGRYAAHLLLDRTHMDAQLTLQEPASGPLEHLVGWPALGALSVQASLAGPRNAEQLQLSIHIGELDAAANGTLDLVHRAADLTYHLTSPAMTPRPELAWQSLSLHGQWHGPLTGPRTDGELAAAGLAIGKDLRIAQLRATLGAQRDLLDLHATVGGLRIPGPQPQLLAQTPLQLEAQMRPDVPDRPLDVSAIHQLFTLRAHALTGHERRMSFELRVPNVAPLAVFVHQPAQGSATFEGNLAQEKDAVRLGVDARIDLTGSNEMLDRVLGPARLSLAAQLQPQQLLIERLQINGRTATLSADGSAQRAAPGAWRLQTLRARYDLQLRDLSSISATLAGNLRVSGEASGPLKSFGTTVKASSQLSVRGSPREPLGASLTLRGLPLRPGGVLHLDGTFDDAPLLLDATLDREVGSWRLIIQRTHWKSLQIEGNLAARTDMRQGSGSVRLRIDQLADLQRLAGTPISGGIAGGVTLTPQGADDTRAQLQLDARDLMLGRLAVDQADLFAVGPIDALQVQLAAHSPQLAGQPVKLTSKAQLNLPERRLDVGTLEMSYDGQIVHLLQPAHLNFAGGLALHQVRLGVQRAVLRADGEIMPHLDLRASLQQVDAGLVNALLPSLLASGTLSAETHLEGSFASLGGHARLSVSDVRFAATSARDLPALDLNANARLEAGEARVTAHLSAGKGSQLDLRGTAPAAATGMVDLKLTGALDAGIGNAFLEAHGSHASGQLRVDASVSGALPVPDIDGSITFERGDVRDYANGIHFADISAKIVGGHGELRIASFSARAGTGAVGLTGTFGLLEPKLPIDVTLTAKNAQPIESDILTANVNADLSVKGTLRERIDLAGTIHVQRANLGIPSSLPPNVAVLDVTRPGQTPPPRSAKRLIIGLDLTLDAPRQVLVQGRGLDAEVGGEIRVRGTTADPHVSGGFELIRGTFTLGVPLNFQSGEVSFNGRGLHGKIDPTLDFTASTTVTDATVTLHISGFADAPKFELTSSPQLPQDEILARLLFGEPAAQLSGLQLATVSYTLYTLSGIGGGGGVLASIQRKLNIDRIQIGAAQTTQTAAGPESQGASVAVGRYVTNRIYVQGKQTTLNTSQVEVDVDLTKHLKLQTRLGNGIATQGTTPENDPGSSVGVSYQFDY
ncbi:MAG TPA: translocation/assembly module TamB domain-containing protein [Steroidobacteraceae bacterium]|nr:translocation/assembly module TamB domain-containing protein [Steroidobacteraceae bacterium]